MIDVLSNQDCNREREATMVTSKDCGMARTVR